MKYVDVILAALTGSVMALAIVVIAVELVLNK